MVRASPERVFAHLAQSEHLPRYATPLWMSADPGEKRGSGQVVTLRGYFAGLPVDSVQRVVLHPPSSVEFIQIRGTLRGFRGRCSFRSVEDGTEVLYRIDVDPGVPMLSDDAARQFLVQFLERMLDRIKFAAERKAPTRPRARALATETALPGIDDEEAEGMPEPPAPQASLAAKDSTTEVPPLDTPVAEPVRPHPEPVAAPPAASTDPGQAKAQPIGRSGPPPSGRRRRRRRRRRRPGGA